MENTNTPITGEPITLPLWKHLAVVAEQWERGDIHTHNEIASIIGVPYMEGRYINKDYSEAITGVQGYLIPLGKKLINVNGVGYYVGVADEYPRYVREEQTKALETWRRSLHLGAHAPRHLMSDPQKELLDRQLATTSRLFCNNVDALNELYSTENKKKIEN